jgi:hypothetical protein
MNFSELIKNGVVAPEIDHAKIMKDVAKMQASDHLRDVGTTECTTKQGRTAHAKVAQTSQRNTYLS